MLLVRDFSCFGLFYLPARYAPKGVTIQYFSLFTYIRNRMHIICLFYDSSIANKNQEITPYIPNLFFSPHNTTLSLPPGRKSIIANNGGKTYFFLPTSPLFQEVQLDAAEVWEQIVAIHPAGGDETATLG